MILVFALIILGGFLLPESYAIPVKNADRKDWHPHSFWYQPWGESGVHKGIDIFAREGTPVVAAVAGVVLYAGQWARGGGIVLTLGPRWRLHYYAHLQTITTSMGGWLSRGEELGRVGTTGNAVGKSPHLHYTIFTLIPYLWHIDTAKYGWMKMFYLNPDKVLP